MEFDLRNSHVILSKASLEQENKTADLGYASQSVIYLAYVEQQQALFVAPINHSWFTKVYQKAKQVLLKQRTEDGELSFSIRDILIDYDLNGEDRRLKVDILESNILKIYLA